MAAVKNLMVRAGADFSGLVKGTQKGTTSLKKFQSNTNKITSNISTSLRSIGKAVGIAFGTYAIVNFVKTSTEAYKTQLENETKLATVMKQRNNATDAEVKSILELTSAQQALGVIGDEVQLAGAQQLATFTNTTDQLKQLIPAMNNLVAQQYGYNATTESTRNIANMMGRALEGNVGALTRVGISLSDAQKEAIKYGDKTQRAAVLAQVITQNVGQMNYALAQTPFGRQKQLSNVMGDVKEQFGKAFTTISTLFIPIISRLATWFGVVAKLANQVAQAIANIFGKQVSAQENVAVSAVAASGSVDDLTDSELDAAEAGKKANKALAGFDELNVLSQDTGGGSGTTETTAGVGGGIGSIGEDLTVNPAIEGAIGKIKEMLAPLQNINLDNLKTAFDNFKTALEPFTSELFAGLKWFWDNILVPLSYWVMNEALPVFLDILTGAINILTSAVDALKPLGVWLWENFLQPIAEWTGGVIVTVLSDIKDGLTGVSDWISKHKPLIEAIVIVIGSFALAWKLVTGAMALWNIAVGVWNSIGPIATAITTAFSVAMNSVSWPIVLTIAAIGALIAIVVLLVKNWDKVKEVAANVWDGIKKVWGAVANWFNIHIVTPIANFFGNLWNGIKLGASTLAGYISTYVIDPVVRLFKFLYNSVVGIMEGIINGFVGIINSFIRGINFAVQTINKIPGVYINPINTLSTVSIPRLATGGIVDSATLATIGENGREAVLPLENNTAWMDTLADKIASRPIVFNGPDDIMQLIRILQPSMTKYNNLKGTNLIVGGV